jgi:hypothetical protein
MSTVPRINSCAPVGLIISDCRPAPVIAIGPVTVNTLPVPEPPKYNDPPPEPAVVIAPLIVCAALAPLRIDAR